MVDTLTYAWLGSAALITTLMCLKRSFANRGQGIEAVASVFAAVLWAVFAIGSFDLEKFHGSSATTIQVESFAVIGMLGAGMMLLFAFQALRGMLRPIEGTEDALP